MRDLCRKYRESWAWESLEYHPFVHWMRLDEIHIPRTPRIFDTGLPSLTLGTEWDSVRSGDVAVS